MQLFLVLSVLASLPCIFGADILAVFPFPPKSHHAVFQPIVIGLAQKGHRVTYVTSNPVKNPPALLKQVELPNVMAEIKARAENRKYNYKLKINLQCFYNIVNCGYLRFHYVSLRYCT